MKLKYYSLAMIIAISSANGASISVATSGDGATIAVNEARAFYDTSENALAFGTGFTAVGGFVSGTPDFMTTTGSNIGSLFTLFGNSTGVFGDNSLGPEIDGLFSYGPSAPILAGNPLIGNAIFFVGGNGVDFGSSTELIVIQFGVTFAEDNPLFTADFNLQIGDGTVVFGSDSFDGSSSPLITDPLMAFGAVNSYQMATLIPEPSVALLGAFGILGLLRRRR